jgi:hypothetical protein
MQFLRQIVISPIAFPMLTNAKKQIDCPTVCVRAASAGQEFQQTQKILSEHREIDGLRLQIGIDVVKKSLKFG